MSFASAKDIALECTHHVREDQRGPSRFDLLLRESSVELATGSTLFTAAFDKEVKGQGGHARFRYKFPDDKLIPGYALSLEVAEESADGTAINVWIDGKGEAFLVIEYDCTP